MRIMIGTQGGDSSTQKKADNGADVRYNSSATPMAFCVDAMPFTVHVLKAGRRCWWKPTPVISNNLLDELEDSLNIIVGSQNGTSM